MENNYKNITSEDIENAVREMFGDDSLTYTELKRRVLSGYAYQIISSLDINSTVRYENTRKTALYTGQSGVLLYIEACEKEKVPAAWVAQSIIVNCDLGKRSLLELTVKEKDEQSRPK